MVHIYVHRHFRRKDLLISTKRVLLFKNTFSLTAQAFFILVLSFLERFILTPESEIDSSQDRIPLIRQERVHLAVSTFQIYFHIPPASSRVSPSDIEKTESDWLIGTSHSESILSSCRSTQPPTPSVVRPQTSTPSSRCSSPPTPSQRSTTRKCRRWILKGELLLR